MPIKKNRTVTQAYGFDLIDGEVKPAAYELPGAYKSDRHILAKIRKEHPNFMLDSSNVIKHTYQLEDEEFFRIAQIINSEEKEN